MRVQPDLVILFTTNVHTLHDNHTHTSHTTHFQQNTHEDIHTHTIISHCDKREEGSGRKKGKRKMES